MVTEGKKKSRKFSAQHFIFSVCGFPAGTCIALESLQAWGCGGGLGRLVGCGGLWWAGVRENRLPIWRNLGFSDPTSRFPFAGHLPIKEGCQRNRAALKSRTATLGNNSSDFGRQKQLLHTLGLLVFLEEAVGRGLAAI